MRSVRFVISILLLLGACLLVTAATGRIERGTARVGPELPIETDTVEVRSAATGTPIPNEPPATDAPAAPTFSGVVIPQTTAALPSPAFQAAASRTPAATPQAAPASSTSNGDTQDTLFYALIRPFWIEGTRRREERTRANADYARRVLSDLNRTRVNLVLFGYGETHEPPATERAIIGSFTILSFDTRTARVDIISLTHDIRGPEIERELAKRWNFHEAVRIDQAFATGGFDLMRTVVEDATALPIDFQVTFKDIAIQHLIDDVFQGVEVQIPVTFEVQPFYLEGRKYDRGLFIQGRERMNGARVIQFIKTVPLVSGAYDRSLEHNARKHLVFQGLTETLNKNAGDAGLWLRTISFVTGELWNGDVSYDFDPTAMLINNIGNTMGDLGRFVGRPNGAGLGAPRISTTRYVVDSAQGDGGVQWVTANAAANPITRRDIDTAVYPSTDMEVPLHANPYGDLVSEYWPSVRNLVREALFPGSVTGVPQAAAPKVTTVATPATGRVPVAASSSSPCQSAGVRPFPWDRVRGIVYPTGEKLYYVLTDGEFLNRLDPRYQEQWFDCAKVAEEAGFRRGHPPRGER